MSLNATGFWLLRWFHLLVLPFIISGNTEGIDVRVPLAAASLFILFVFTSCSVEQDPVRSLPFNVDDRIDNFKGLTIEDFIEKAFQEFSSYD